MFGKRYSFDRKSAVNSVASMLERGATALINLDVSNKPMGERIEQLIAREINADEDILLMTRRIRGKFGIDTELIVVPKINDGTLLITGYVLATPNAQNVLTPIVEKKDADELANHLMDVCLTNDEGKVKAFQTAYLKAVGNK